MSKLSFRARQVDFTKPLPIYLNHDLPDLQDFAAINRSVPQMPTGMEKDEEAEHHLQRALSALQAFGDKSSNDYSIPTPKVEIDNKMYERIYNIECPKQKQYIRIQPFSNDYDYPDYDADYEDEDWLAEKKKTLPDDFIDDLLYYFETIMDRLEKATSYSNNLMSLEEAKFLLLKDAANDENDYFNNNSSSFPKPKYRAELEEFLISIYEYWKKKRTKWKHPLTPIVMTDKSGIVTQPNNPYLVFRRRTEKMQTRKNRKNEEQSYEKMLILKRDLCRAQHILKLIKKRENLKKDFLKLTLETFEKRFKLNDYDGSVTDQITCMLKPSATSIPHQTVPGSAHAAGNGSANQNITNNTHLLNLNHENNKTYWRDKLGQNNNHYNHKTSEKNLSSIDKTIVNLINSNKLKTLGSPPHSSLKKVPQLENDFLVDSIFNNNDSKKLNEKARRQKKEKRIREDSNSSAHSNTISNLISLNKHNIDLSTSKKIFGDLMDMSQKNKLNSLQSLNKSAGHNNSNNKLTVNNLQNFKSTVSPLNNRSNTKLDLIKKSNKLNLNTSELEQLQLNRIANSQRRRNNSINSRQPNGQLTNQNENNLNSSTNNNIAGNKSNLNHIDGNNNKKLNTSGSLADNNESAGSTRDSPSQKDALQQKLLAENADLVNILNELKDYEEELKANQIDNLDSILSETKNRLSTSSDKDGYWYFKRKEGCKYLPQNGPIFKNDDLEEPVFAPKPSLVDLATMDTSSTSIPIAPQSASVSTHPPPNSVKKPKKMKRKDRLRELQQFYYGYAITKHNRNLGLVRRRAGRGGRIVLDKFNDNLTDSINDSDLTPQTNTNKLEQIFSFNFNKYKTYYPYECFELNDSGMSTKNSEFNKKLINSNILSTLPPPPIVTSLSPSRVDTPSSSSSSSSNEQNPKKKLKLKNFNDSFKFNDDEQNNIEISDPIYDHNVFNSYQLEQGLYFNAQFIDKETESELTVEPDQALVENNIDTEKFEQNRPVPKQEIFTIQNPVDFDFISTELDAENLFEPDPSDEILVDSHNVLKLETNTASFNQEYLAKSTEDVLSLASVKQALKCLKLPTLINNEKKNKSDEEENARNDIGLDKNEDGDFRLPSPALSNGETKIEIVQSVPILTNFSSSESLANITSTTLTPPSPSPPSSQTTDINLKKEPLNDIKDSAAGALVPQALNKITILSNTQPNGNNSRFGSLNKVGLNCITSQFQFQSLLSSKPIESPVQNGNSYLTPPPTYLVKKQVKNENLSNQSGNIVSTLSGTNTNANFYSTSSSSSPSSSSLILSSNSSVPGIVANSSNSSVITQPSVAIVNGLLSKKKDENNPFYPVYHTSANSHQEAQYKSIPVSSEANQSSVKRLQAIHLNQSNQLASASSSLSSAASSSLPSSSQSPIVDHNLQFIQKSSNLTNSNGNMTATSEHNNAAKLINSLSKAGHLKLHESNLNEQPTNAGYSDKKRIESLKYFSGSNSSDANGTELSVHPASLDSSPAKSDTINLMEVT